MISQALGSRSRCTVLDIVVLSPCMVALTTLASTRFVRPPLTGPRTRRTRREEQQQRSGEGIERGHGCTIGWVGDERTESHRREDVRTSCRQSRRRSRSGRRFDSANERRAECCSGSGRLGGWTKQRSEDHRARGCESSLMTARRWWPDAGDTASVEVLIQERRTNTRSMTRIKAAEDKETEEGGW